MGYIVGVCNTCLKRDIFYNEIDEYETECDDCGGKYEEIPVEQYTARDYVKMMSSDLEDGNYHNITNLPELMYNTMNKYDVTDEKMKYIMQELYEKIWDIL